MVTAKEALGIVKKARFNAVHEFVMAETEQERKQHQFFVDVCDVIIDALERVPDDEKDDSEGSNTDT